LVTEQALTRWQVSFGCAVPQSLRGSVLWRVPVSVFKNNGEWL